MNYFVSVETPLFRRSCCIFGFLCSIAALRILPSLPPYILTFILWLGSNMAICYVFSRYLKGAIESSVEISPYAWNFRIVSANQVQANGNWILYYSGRSREKDRSSTRTSSIAKYGTTDEGKRGGERKINIKTYAISIGPMMFLYRIVPVSELTPCT